MTFGVHQFRSQGKPGKTHNSVKPHIPYLYPDFITHKLPKIEGHFYNLKYQLQSKIIDFDGTILVIILVLLLYQLFGRSRVTDPPDGAEIGLLSRVTLMLASCDICVTKKFQKRLLQPHLPYKSTTLT